MFGEIRDVFLAFPECRQMNRDDVQSKEQILAKFFFLNFFLQISIRRDDDSHIDFHGLITTHRIELPLLYYAQQLGLNGKRHISDLV